MTTLFLGIYQNLEVITVMLKKLLLFLLVPLSLLLLGGLLLISTIDLDQYRDYIIEAIETQTDRKAVIGEKLEIELLPQPRLLLTDLRLQNAPWGAAPDMLSIRRLEAELALTPLITGEVVIKRIGVYDAVLLLERSRTGEENWRFTKTTGAEEEQESATLPDIRELNITGLTIDWRDHGADDSHRLQLDRALLRRQGASDALQLEVRGEQDTRPFKLAARITPAAEATEQTSIEGIHATIGTSDVRGNMTIEQRPGGKSRFAADLHSEQLRLEDFSPPEEEEDKNAKGPEKLFSQKPLPVAALNLWDGSAAYRIGRLERKQLSIKDLELDIRLKNGVLTGNAKTAGVEKARIRIDSAAQPPHADLTLEVPDLELGDLIRTETGKQPLTGKGTLSMELQGRGDSIAAIMAGLDGHVRLLTGKGRLNMGGLDSLTGGLWSILGTLTAKDSESAVMNCLASDFKIEKGIASSRAFLIDSEHATLFGNGTLDLRKEKVDFLLKPEPKTVTLNVAVPVQVGGTLAKPNYTLEKTQAARKAIGVIGLFAFPPAALIGLGELGTGEENPCLQIAREGTVPGKSKGVVERGGTAVKETLEGVGDKLEGVGGKLKGLLSK